MKQIGDCATGKSAICQVLGSDGSMYPKTYSSVTNFCLILKLKLIHFQLTNIRL
jgi:hypothetical protein